MSLFTRLALEYPARFRLRTFFEEDGGGNGSSFNTGYKTADGDAEKIPTGSNREECDQVCKEEYTSSKMAQRRAANLEAARVDRDKSVKDMKKEEEGNQGYAASALRMFSKGADDYGRLNALKDSGTTEKDCRKHCATEFPGMLDWLPCFAADTEVIVRGDKGDTRRRALHDVRIGDLILVDGCAEGQRFEPVLTWLHRVPSHRALFVHLTVKSSMPLKLTPGHLLYSVLRDVSVESVDSVIQDGIYSPLTSSGTLVAGGALCSCYAVPKADDFSMLYNLFGEHQLLHATTYPMRLLRERELRRENLGKKSTSDLIGMDPLAALFWNPRNAKLRDHFEETGWI